MYKPKNKGLAIVETILVIAISAALFVIVIGVFSSRQKTQNDDAARQVMAEIAKVRNEAQQGEGPTTQAERDVQSGKELFGKALIFNVDSIGLTPNIVVENLFVDTQGNISKIVSDEIKLFDRMYFYISAGSNSASYCLDNITTCFKSGNDYVNLGSNLPTTDGSLVLVFLNRTGAGYALGSNNYTTKSNYTSAQQVDIRLALAVVEEGTTAQDKMNSAVSQYYANINLPIPNSQSLEVVK
jgi:type II secretory pathway pseudopilin PulG